MMFLVSDAYSITEGNEASVNFILFLKFDIYWCLHIELVFISLLKMNSVIYLRKGISYYDHYLPNSSNIGSKISFTSETSK